MTTVFHNELTKYQTYSNLSNKLGLENFIFKFFGVFFVGIVLSRYIMDNLIHSNNKDLFFIISIILPLGYVAYSYKRWQKIIQEKENINFEDVELYKFLTHYFKTSDQQKIDIYYKIISAEHLKNEVATYSNHPDKNQQINTLLNCIDNKTVVLNSKNILKQLKKSR